jgi:hypothetical protein
MARKSKRGVTRKILRVPQAALNTVLGIAGSTRKGTVRVAKRTGKGAFKITGTALGTARNVSKAAVGTVGNVGVKATKGVTKIVKDSIDLASNLTTGILKGVSGIASARKRRATRRRR